MLYILCSFPKDYEMEKDKLIQLWMANGFIHEKGNMDLTRKGELVFNELVQRSFLQDVKMKYIYDSGYRRATGCKMHDLMNVHLQQSLLTRKSRRRKEYVTCRFQEMN
jgi:hypothetical protein